MAKSVTLETNWCRTRLGLNIPIFRSQNNVKGGLLWIGGVHGDEPEGVVLSLQTLKSLRSRAEPPPFPWTLIPCLNPEGVTLKQRTNSQGVDLNRNYPSQDWAPVAKQPRYFPGPSPGSEPEIQALIQLIQDEQPQLIIHCHSWKPCIVSSCDRHLNAAQYLAEATGYPLVENIGYDTPGSLSSYAWRDKKIPVICIEEQEGTNAVEIWPRFAPAVQRIFSEALS